MAEKDDILIEEIFKEFIMLDRKKVYAALIVVLPILYVALRLAISLHAI